MARGSGDGDDDPCRQAWMSHVRPRHVYRSPRWRRACASRASAVICQMRCHDSPAVRRRAHWPPRRARPVLRHRADMPPPPPHMSAAAGTPPPPPPPPPPCPPATASRYRRSLLRRCCRRSLLRPRQEPDPQAINAAIKMMSLVDMAAHRNDLIICSTPVKMAGQTLREPIFVGVLRDLKRRGLMIRPPAVNVSKRFIQACRGSRAASFGASSGARRVSRVKVASSPWPWHLFASALVSRLPFLRCV